MRSKYIVMGIVVGVLLSLVVVVLAGNLDSPAAPGATSSYTLEDIYDRLDDGTAGSQSTFTEPSSGPGSTMHTLNDIMGKAPVVDDTNGATTAQVLSGKTYWSLRTSGGTWGTQTGTAAAGSDVPGSDGAKEFDIPDGFYSGKKATANDADLVAGSIARGVDLFGVSGICRAVRATGQTTSYAAGDDGEYQLGCRPGVYPPWASKGFNRGFTHNGDGTVTDNLTGLIWLKNANCFGSRTWTDALSDANGLASGSCGLTDGSSAGDWRLPNVNELSSLVDRAQTGPALPAGHPFTGVQSNDYWSSTTYAPSASYAWYVSLHYGYVNLDVKTDTHYVWPVRGGQ